MPDISLPEIKLPDVKWRDSHLRDVKLPDIDLRDRIPDVDLSKVPLPATLRELSMPDVRMPDVNLSKVRMPDVSVPDFKGMNVDLSGLDAKRLRELAPFMKPARKPASPLPWVLVAAVGGLFAGWWLATSAQTGPRLRQMTAGVRARIGDWRNARTDLDESGDMSDGSSRPSAITHYGTPAANPASASMPMNAGGTGDDFGNGGWPDSSEGSAAAASSGNYGGSGFEPDTRTTDGESQEG